MQRAGLDLNNDLASAAASARQVILAKQGAAALSGSVGGRDSTKRALVDLHLKGILDAAEALACRVSEFQKTFDVEPLARTNEDVLTGTFIAEMTMVWRRYYGKYPARSNSGPFVRFVAAAWRDLQFPLPLDHTGSVRNDLEGWLGDRIVANQMLKALTQKT